MAVTTGDRISGCQSQKHERGNQENQPKQIKNPKQTEDPPSFHFQKRTNTKGASIAHIKEADFEKCQVLDLEVSGPWHIQVPPN